MDADAAVPSVLWRPVACPACGAQRVKNLRRVTAEVHRCACRQCGLVFQAVSPIPVWPRERRAVHVADEARR